MPVPTPSPPPPAFRESCERWARGTATPYDNAVLTSLTTGEPLPQPYDPQPVGFLSSTRLPPVSTIHLFHSVKNEVRVRFHRSSTASTEASILVALRQSTSTSPIITATTEEFPKTLSAAPARRGLVNACTQALGASHTVSWTVHMACITSAGVAFIHAARAHGWQPQGIDDENATGMITWLSHPSITDSQIAKTIVLLSRCGSHDDMDVVPAGEVCITDTQRISTARAELVPRLMWRARVAVGTRRRVALSTLLAPSKSIRRTSSISNWL